MSAMAKDDDKARLYRRITTVPHFVVLDRMRAHGYWPSSAGLPADPPDEAAERAAIEKELGALQSTAKLDPEAIEKALREERARRWEESKKRRAEKKKLREAREAARRAAWNEKKKGLVVHVGDGHSGGLQATASDAEALGARGLPLLHTAADLAGALGIPLARLRFLTYHRGGATIVHYHRYSIPKKTGGIRGISAPKPALARAQQWVLANVVAKLKIEAEAHGFVPGRSIVTNASPHLGRRVVVNMDLREFFPTVTFRRTKGLFASLGYSGQVATLLALLCTEPPRVAATLDGKRLAVAIGERRLPQGACTSPGITNAVCRALDRRLAGLARAFGCTYTRYADDLTFSSDDDARLGVFLHCVRGIVKDEGFDEHEKKTRIMRRGRRQEVTGVIVNDKPTVSRDEVRRLRAILHNAKKAGGGAAGLESQNRASHPRFVEWVRGKIAFVAMVDSARGAALKGELDRILGAPRTD
jgi:retron-type reverse transcriptase